MDLLHEYDILVKPPISIPLLRHRLQKLVALKISKARRLIEPPKYEKAAQSMDSLPEKRTDNSKDCQKFLITSRLSRNSKKCCESQNNSSQVSSVGELQKDIIDEYITKAKYEENCSKDSNSQNSLLKPRIVINIPIRKSSSRKHILPPLRKSPIRFKNPLRTLRESESQLYKSNAPENWAVFGQRKSSLPIAQPTFRRKIRIGKKLIHKDNSQISEVGCQASPTTQNETKKDIFADLLEHRRITGYTKVNFCSMSTRNQVINYNM